MTLWEPHLPSPISKLVRCPSWQGFSVASLTEPESSLI
jgi:hypothetical protein